MLWSAELIAHFVHLQIVQLDRPHHDVQTLPQMTCRSPANLLLEVWEQEKRLETINDDQINSMCRHENG